MGSALTKRNISDIDSTKSCNLAEFWNVKLQDFHQNFFDNENDNIKTTLLKTKASDFEVLSLLDEGSYGSVMLTTHIKTGKVYAAKVIAKKKIVKNEIVGQMYNEKRILESINFPFVVHLEYFYQDHSFLYFVMPFLSGGNILTHMKRYGVMDENKARFYAAEILLAIEYLHRLDLVHRDIKTENILLNVHGHAQLADFGFCKHVTGRTFTFCGTPEYIAPEIILGQGYGKSVDYWAFGIFLFELVDGDPPFTHLDLELLFRSIILGKYFGLEKASVELRNLLRNLLKVDTTKRYGNMANGVRDIKKHRWFQPTNWCAMFDGQMTPPFVPTINDTKDTRNFDKLSTKIFLTASKDYYEDKFKDF